MLRPGAQAGRPALWQQLGFRRRRLFGHHCLGQHGLSRPPRPGGSPQRSEARMLPEDERVRAAHGPPQ